jgi:hypothetical protein
MRVCGNDQTGKLLTLYFLIRYQPGINGLPAQAGNDSGKVIAETACNFGVMN